MIIVNERKSPSTINTAHLFTDREDATKRFCEVYDVVKNTNNGVCVLSVCGLGGIGKSFFLEKMIDTVVSEKSEYLFFSFERNRENQRESFLINFVYQLLEKKPSLDLSEFLYVYKLLFGETNEQIIKELASTKFAKKKGLLGFAGAVVSDYMPFGGNTFSWVLETLIDKIENNEKKEFKEKINGIPREELYSKLHEFFSHDVYPYFEKLKRPYVVFLDGYEKYMRPDGYSEKRNDKWLMELVTSLPNVLWVFSGREPLDWNEEYGIENIKLENFSRNFVEEYFRKYEEKYNVSGLKAENLDYIYELTGGVPVYLHICLDNYHKIQDKNNIKNEDIGRDTEDLLKRFFNNYSEAQKMAMLYLCCLPDGFTEENAFEIFNMIDTCKTGLHFDLGILHSLKKTVAFEENGESIRIHSVVRNSVLKNAEVMERIAVIKSITDAMSAYAHAYEEKGLFGKAIYFREEICRCWEIWGSTHRGWEEYLADEELLLAKCYLGRYHKLMYDTDAKASVKYSEKAVEHLKLVKDPGNWKVLEAEHERIQALLNICDMDKVEIISNACFKLVQEQHMNEKEKSIIYVFYLWNWSGENNDIMLSFMEEILNSGINKKSSEIIEKEEYIKEYKEKRASFEQSLEDEMEAKRIKEIAEAMRLEREQIIAEYDAFIKEYHEEIVYDEKSLEKYMLLADRLLRGVQCIFEANDVWEKLYNALKREAKGNETVQSVKILVKIAESLNDSIAGNLIEAEKRYKEIYEILLLNPDFQSEINLKDVVSQIADLCETLEKVEESVMYKNILESI